MGHWALGMGHWALGIGLYPPCHLVPLVPLVPPVPPIPSPSGKLSLYKLTIRNRRIRPMSEIVAAALLPVALVFIGWGLGVLLLKIQGAEPE